MKKKKYEYRAPKPALNIVRQVEGGYQVFQLYGDMMIPLLVRRTPRGLVPSLAKSVDEAFDRLNNEYYE